MERKMHGLPRGIAIMTSWLEANQDDELVGSEILANVAEGIDAEVEMTFGLLNLASLLLVRLEAAEQKPAAVILQDFARRYGT